jgi:hypothetical protein
MRALTIAVLCGCLLMSGCKRQEVNSLSVFEYKSSDDACMIALKTSGNFIPWVGEAVILTGVFVGVAMYTTFVAAVDGFPDRPRARKQPDRDVNR